MTQWHRFGELTRSDVLGRASQAAAVVPIGSLEQHGPHPPVATDLAIVSAIAERATLRAAEQIDVVVTPALPFGFAHHHLPFGGTISVGDGDLQRLSLIHI